MAVSSYQCVFGGDPQARMVVQEGLKAFNCQQIGPYAYHDVELYARDQSGQVVGGLFGHSGMGWLYVDYLWLSPMQRGAGLGSQLMALVEQEAQRRGCVGVFLYTYSFQSPDFYQKLGFEFMGVLDDCPPGHRRVYLKKSIVR